MKAVILLSLFAAVFAIECGENQHYESCGTACPLTCENYKYQSDTCNLMCNAGCQCDEGFVRTKKGSCVRPEQCPEQDTDFCRLLPRRGPCFEYHPRYFYNEKTGKCAFFIYSGCGGNGNNFETEEKCQKTCNVIPKQSISNVCSLPAEQGLCDALIPRFFYDETRSECRHFIYGGCGGNANNFKTIEECERTCDVIPNQSNSNVCSLPAEQGVCDALIPRFFYDETRSECRHFIYGGCGGNANNFKTVEECEKACGEREM